MRKLREWIFRLRGLFNKQRNDRELDEEIESHLQMHVEDNLGSGMTHEEARRQAMIKLGGIESTKEAYRDQRGLLGVLVAYGGIHTLLAWNEGPVRHLAEAHVDERMLGFALFIALGTGV